MADLFYPPIDAPTVKNLGLIRVLAKEHPSYFLESPYPSEVEKFIKEMNNEKQTSEVIDTLDLIGPKKYENLANEAGRLYNELLLIKFDADTPNEKLGYFKTANALMTNLVSLQERSIGMKEVSDFHRVVMEIMETTLTPTQRTEVMEKLQQALGN